ncbi:MAG: hypothetical protein K8W52_20820 [Deltaproteobacteria bacterium]|nr:hypothetical protein [Deltaproteobacteria bacterium]
MQRTRGIVVGALVGVAAIGAVALASRRLDAHAAARAEAYDESLAASKRALVASVPDRAPVASSPVCVRGAEGLAVATAAALATDVRKPDGRLDPAALATLSRASFAAARDREDRTRAPALPQRMGVVDGAAVAMGAERCAGKPAFAAAAVTVPAR